MGFPLGLPLTLALSPQAGRGNLGGAWLPAAGLMRLSVRFQSRLRRTISFDRNGVAVSSGSRPAAPNMASRSSVA